MDNETEGPVSVTRFQPVTVGETYRQKECMILSCSTFTFFYVVMDTRCYGYALSYGLMYSPANNTTSQQCCGTGLKNASVTCQHCLDVTTCDIHFVNIKDFNISAHILPVHI